jgi:hypothetical protein
MTKRRLFQTAACAALGFAALATASAFAAGAAKAPDFGDTLTKPPTLADWTALAKLPDWSGTWNPDQRQQVQEITKNPTPWTPKAAAMIELQAAHAKAGHPDNLFINCLPEGMPSWMMIQHDSFEALFTPGRVTLLGESDGNRLRRIWTDGRKHSEDPDDTFFGESIGHWEGDTLVVDTIGVKPEAFIAPGEDSGVPNNGDMHIVERIHIVKPDTISDDMVITAPHVLTAPWSTQRIYYRQRAHKFDMVEGECLEDIYTPDVDKDGNHIFVERKLDQAIPIPKN